MPTFIYGEEQFHKFIQINLNYPGEALMKAIQGKVYVSFVVDSTGNVLYPTVLKDIGGGCGEEAVRVIGLTSSMWKPGINSGMKSNVQIRMPVKFTCSNCTPSKGEFVRYSDPMGLAERFYKRGTEELDSNRYLTSIFYFTKTLDYVPDYKDSLKKRGIAKLKNYDIVGACKDWHATKLKHDQELNELIKNNCD